MIEAVIFDLDGTILDNEGDWEAAFREVARRNNIPEPKLTMPNGWWHEPGLGLEANWRRVADAKKIDDLTRETWKEYHNNFAVGADLKLRPEVEEVVAKVKEKGWMTALCTGSSWYVVEPELTSLELHLAFDVTTTGEEVLMSKPDPEIFLLTAQKLNVEPKNCLVVEDAIAGVRAAAEAGMQVVGLVSEYAMEKTLRTAGAGYTVAKLSEVAELTL